MPYPRAAVETAFFSLPHSLDSLPARRILAAIGYQESRYRNRRQVIERNGALVEAGPACGYWQFESGGGVKGVMNFAGRVSQWAREICELRGVPWVRNDVWLALSQDDVLAAAFARLLMFTDPQPLPTTAEAAWALYLRVWRPGKPHAATWPAAWAFALEQYP